jgi:hypothetical protein
VAEVVDGFLDQADALRGDAGLDWPVFAVGLQLSAAAAARLGLEG